MNARGFHLDRSGLTATFYESTDSNLSAGRGPPLWVVVLGFMGATERNMAKHARCWFDAVEEEHNVQRVLSVIPPLTYVLKQGMHLSYKAHEGPYEQIALDIVDGTKAADRVFVQVCSQNGAFAYRTLMSCSETFRRKVIGTVFDSAPVRLTANAVDTAIRQAIGPFAGASLCALLRLLIGGGAQYDARLCAQDKLYQDWFFSELMSKEAEPSCFLFSSADKISDACYISSAVESRRRIGQYVQWYDFRKSGHVAHLSNYAEEYRTQIAIFVKHCLRSPGQHAVSKL